MCARIGGGLWMVLLPVTAWAQDASFQLFRLTPTGQVRATPSRT
jgi:hypothetical protein